MSRALWLFIISLLLNGCSDLGSSDDRSSPTSSSGGLSGNLVGSWKTDNSDIVFSFGPDGSYQETQYVDRDLIHYTIGTYTDDGNIVQILWTRSYLSDDSFDYTQKEPSTLRAGTYTISENRLRFNQEEPFPHVIHLTRM